MTLWQRLRQAVRRQGPRPQPPSPKPETPYRRRYTKDRSFEELVRQARKNEK